jgi:hypothetical protein
MTSSNDHETEAFWSMKQKFPDASEDDLLRFLKARKFRKQAVDMYQAHLDWRNEILPILQDHQQQILENLSTRKFYLLDHTDPDGRPVIFFCLRRFKEMGYDVDEEEMAMIYMMENDVIPKLEQQQHQQYTVLIDVSGIRSPPLSFLTRINAVMEANYPERVYRIILFPVPYLVQKIITGMLIFVAKETREKFFYVNSVSALEECAKMSVETMGRDVVELVDKNTMHA